MKIQEYRDTLRSLPAPSSEAGQKAWRDYLIEHSGLPGPRGNLELAQAVALEGNEAMFAGIPGRVHAASSARQLAAGVPVFLRGAWIGPDGRRREAGIPVPIASLRQRSPLAHA